MLCSNSKSHRACVSTLILPGVVATPLLKGKALHNDLYDHMRMKYEMGIPQWERGVRGGGLITPNILDTLVGPSIHSPSRHAVGHVPIQQERGAVVGVFGAVQDQPEPAVHHLAPGRSKQGKHTQRFGRMSGGRSRVTFWEGCGSGGVLDQWSVRWLWFNFNASRKTKGIL